MRLAPHIFLLLVVASCGGSSASHLEVARLRADVAAMETRLQQAEAKQLDQLASDDAAPVVPSAAPDMNPESTVVEIFAGIAERVCACDDMKCVTSEVESIEALKNEEEPGPEGKKAIADDMEKMTECIMKLAEADIGTP